MNSEPSKFEIIDVNEYLLESSKNIDLIASLINSQKNKFFESMNIKDLKRIDDRIFNNLSKECIKDLNLNTFESLIKTEKIGFLPDFFLNEIDKSLLEKLNDKFYEELKQKHINKLNNKTIKTLIDLGKFIKLDGEIFKSFCETVSFSDIEPGQIFSILKELNRRNKFQYLTGYNFICLDKYINCKEIEPYLEKLKFVHYNKNLNMCWYRKPILQ